MSQSSTVTCSDVLDYSGEEDVGNVYELVFRANTPPITGFDPECASELSNSLELLSLSRNQFQTLTTLSPLSNLIELNVNFNAIGPTLTTSTDRRLSPFPCLKKLYLRPLKTFGNYALWKRGTGIKVPHSIVSSLTSCAKGVTLHARMDLGGNQFTARNLQMNSRRWVWSSIQFLDC